MWDSALSAEGEWLIAGLEKTFRFPELPDAAQAS